MRSGEVGAFSVGQVEPWSAEVPRLYEARVSSVGEALSLSMQAGTPRER